MKRTGVAVIKMQMALNQRLYEAKQIPYHAYAAANGVLTARLTKIQ